MEMPTIEQMKRDLLNGGWKRFTADTWKAPWGTLYRGPYRAWTIWAGVKMEEPK